MLAVLPRQRVLSEPKHNMLAVMSRPHDLSDPKHNMLALPHVYMLQIYLLF